MGTQPAAAPSHRSDPVAPYLVQLLRCASEEAAHQHEVAIKNKARVLMQAYRLAGSRNRGDRWLAELRATLEPTMPALTPDLIQKAEQADSDEAEAQCGYLCQPSAATARRWRVSLETETSIHYDLILALRSYEAIHG